MTKYTPLLHIDQIQNKRVLFRVGYYADQLSVAQETRGNLTIKVKNESRGFHLNNLSYAGPIVMGVGGNTNTHCTHNLQARCMSRPCGYATVVLRR